MELQRLIPADVHHGKREQLRDLVEDVLEESARLLPARADQGRKNASRYLDPVIPAFHGCAAGAGAAEFGIRGEQRAGMAGDLDLGYDFDPVFPGIGHDVTDLFACVVSAVVFRPGYSPEKGFTADRALFRKPWISEDLDAPSLVVGQVPVHAVHSAHGRCPDQLFDIAYRHVMADDVQHKAPMGKCAR